jgi:hypothetical protein
MARRNQFMDMKEQLETLQQNFANSIWTPLCEIMRQKGSDKSTYHNYTKVYDALFHSMKDSAEHVLEIGIGTNNTDVLSNMGVSGTPGASLRGWREYFTKAHIWGCDVDKRILFQEDRITTFFLDQLQDDLDSYIPEEDLLFDIIIDDGLHDPAVNFFTLRKLWKRLKPGGYYIVEDLLKTNQLISLYSQWNADIMSEMSGYDYVYLDLPGTAKPDNVLFVIRKKS